MKCLRCGANEAHFVPPSFGDTGFYSCDPNDGPKPSRTPENYTVQCINCRKMIFPGDAWKSVSYGRYAHEECNA